MKATKILLLLILVVSFFRCDSDDINGEMTYSGSPFVKIFLITDNDNNPIEADDELETNESGLEEYTHNSIKPLKVPVVLTYPGLDHEVTVDFSTDVKSGFSTYFIEPAEAVTFNSGSYTDTITIYFSERWNEEDSINFDFALESVDDASINLGQLNDELANKELSVTLGQVNTSVSFSTNRMEITGEAGEQIEFELEFDNGFIPEEIENLDLITELAGFDYTLETVINDENYETVKYIMTLNEDIQNDEVTYTTTFSLNDDSDYEPTGTTILQVVKPLNIERDNSVFTASDFYDLSDTYYRTYAELWLYDDGDEVCEWQRATMFTYPVVVDKDHDNAVLYTDNGTEDESDDIYHHAFRIGFDSPNAGRTTNSFGLKYWFDNEYTDEDESPGFNIEEALEFYPTDGTSETEGTVLVIPQIITISSKDDVSYNISISGEGTYKEVSDGLFEIELEFRATNEELFGGTQTAYYFMYNSSSYGGDPDDLTVGCIEEVEL